MTEIPLRSAGAIDVLVVDDSAVIRQVMQSVLGHEHGFKVRTAADPFIAMRKMESQRPDVILLDLEMPRMDGLTFLRKLMAEDPIPVVICSSLVPDGSEMAMRALQFGAVDVVLKPRIAADDPFAAWKENLVERITAAAQANVGRPLFSRRRTASTPASIGRVHPIDRAIVIGASTGGTEAIAEILSNLPENCPATVIVQHMPSPYTAAFARRLDATCAMHVREATDGECLEQGTVLIAPGNRHATLVPRRGNSIAVALTDDEPVNRHRPSVDVLFHSAAQVLGSSAIAILLTGMGADGAKGLLQLRKCGAVTIAQDESTSVVFGMPRVAIESGAAVHVLPLHRISETIVTVATRPHLSIGASRPETEYA